MFSLAGQLSRFSLAKVLVEIREQELFFSWESRGGWTIVNNYVFIIHFVHIIWALYELLC